MKSVRTLVIAFATFLVTATTLAASFASQAEVLSPYQVASKAGENLFSEIVANKAKLEEQPDFMAQIVEDNLMPYVDHRYAAYKILGKNLKKTTKEQRTNFVKTMREYLVQTYAKALAQYNNETVRFEAVGKHEGKKIVPVKAIIENPNKDLIIVFKMRKNSKTKEWKAFDMVVEGISLLSSKRAELGNRIRANGIEKVTTELANLTSH